MGRETASWAMMAFLLVAIPYSAAANGKPAGNPVVDQSQLPPTYIPPGDQMFRQFCATCHGADAKGHGPLSYSLKVPPADLTTLTKRHGGKFPYSYVSDVLLFGAKMAPHGSQEMPTWGPLFRYLDKPSEEAVHQRIKNISNYLATLQED
jgi:mono/diheme cytochrome c family protein